MFIAGFADEASLSAREQVRALKILGWRHLEARSVGSGNIHDIPEEEFEEAAKIFLEEGIEVFCFGSAIANWSCSVLDPFEKDLAAAKRAIARMKVFGSKMIRIMSYPVIPGTQDQRTEERFRRLRILTDLFLENGIQPLHENCANYGGQGPRYTLEILENVPGLKLVFDTGNPVSTFDKDKGTPGQSSWEFYSAVKEHVVHVHIKDGIALGDGMRWTYPGEGSGDVERIVADLVESGYDGGFSIEPHVKVVAHDPSVTAGRQEAFDAFVEYGRRFEAILKKVSAKNG